MATRLELSRRRLGRREFLRTSAAALGGLPLGAAALAACTRTAPRGRRALPLPRPDRPVTWPIHEDNPPIASGLPIERGATLRIYQWREYLYEDVLRDFANQYRAHDVSYEVESFVTIDEAIAGIRRPGANFDVFFPTIEVVGSMVEARSLRPLNHDYLPNLPNLWPQFRGPEDPFYDGGQRYTVPYTVYTTGIGWRSDLVVPGDAPEALDNPYDVLWNPRYRERVGIYDDYREALGMALLHGGHTDVNDAGPGAIASAERDLLELAETVQVAVTAEGAAEGLPGGRFAVHQAWSGDLISAPKYGQRYGAPTAEPDPALRFFWPRDGRGLIGADLTAILTTGRNPVLAHAFVDHLLDVDVAYENFAWNGYQPPITQLSPDVLVGPRSIVPEHLASTIARPQDLDAGRMLLGLPPSAEAMWLQSWRRFIQRA